MLNDGRAPPYQRIAESLRVRIESGQLRPGDRVPSTRALARKWKVALATAAHALSALAEEGLVSTVPRAGTVVANGATKGPSGRAGPELTRARIVQSAIAIAEQSVRCSWATATRSAGRPSTRQGPGTWLGFGPGAIVAVTPRRRPACCVRGWLTSCATFAVQNLRH